MAPPLHLSFNIFAVKLSVEHTRREQVTTLDKLTHSLSISVDYEMCCVHDALKNRYHVNFDIYIIPIYHIQI